MIVECGQCHTKFKIGDDKITAAGVKVRCSKCKSVFTVKKVEPPLAASAPARTLPPHPPTPPLAVPAPPPLTSSAISAIDNADIPEDIFSAPTKIGPPPTANEQPVRPTPPGANLPPPPFPTLGSSILDQIDLDSDMPILGLGASAPPSSRTTAKPPPSREPSAVPRTGISPSKPVLTQTRPSPSSPQSFPPAPVATSRPSISAEAARPRPGPPSVAEDLFADLSLDDARSPFVSDLDPLVGAKIAPATQPDKHAPAPAVTAHPSDDLFVGLVRSKPVAPAQRPQPGTPQPLPVQQEEDPFADIEISQPAPTAPSSVAQKPVPDPELDDPFAQLDISTGPASPAKTSLPEESLFGDQGDPFAGLEPTEGKQPSQPPPLPPTPAASGNRGLDEGDLLFGPSSDSPPTPASPSAPMASAQDDPFAALDGNSAPAAGGSGSDMVGHDPFSDLEASNAPDGASQESLSLDLDDSRKAPDKGPPAVPPPADSPLPAKPVAPAKASEPGIPPAIFSSSVPIEPFSRGVSQLLKVGFGLLFVLLLLLLFVIYRHGGKPDLTKWSTYVEAFTGSSSNEHPTTDFNLRQVASTTFNPRLGQSLAVFWGEVENSSKETKRRITVSGQWTGIENQIIGGFTAPAGISFEPSEIFEMTDPEKILAAYREKLPKVAALDLGPGKTMPFMLVVNVPAGHLDDLKVRLQAATSDDPLLGLPPAPSPESGTSAPVAPTPNNVEGKPQDTPAKTPNTGPANLQKPPAPQPKPTKTAAPQTAVPTKEPNAVIQPNTIRLKPETKEGSLPPPPATP